MPSTGCSATRCAVARGEDGAAPYFRLSTRPVDQAPFDAARIRLGEEQLRRLVLAGAYRLVDAGSVDGPDVYLVGCGAVLPEVVAAAARLADRGVAAHVVDITSPTGSTPPGAPEGATTREPVPHPGVARCSTRCFPSGRRR